MNDAQKFMKNWLETPESREEWIEKKAIELSNKIHLKDSVCNYVKDFIRSLIQEVT